VPEGIGCYEVMGIKVLSSFKNGDLIYFQPAAVFLESIPLPVTALIISDKGTWV